MFHRLEAFFQDGSAVPVHDNERNERRHTRPSPFYHFVPPAYNRAMQNEFPAATDVCYLNSASEGLLPVRSLRAMQNFTAMKQRPQLLGDPQYFEMPERCRTLLASMLHCSSTEIALIPSTSYG